MPDGAAYYSNSERRIVTDIDLGVERQLDDVMEYIDGKPMNEWSLLPWAWELWLRQLPSEAMSTHDTLQKEYWVNHPGGILASDPPAPEEVSSNSGDTALCQHGTLIGFYIAIGLLKLS